ncbi:hypothetical protein BDB00DRAFT_156444 [Zychaea mexicana]|uniref:uncharacterized protein n=1 Tax=Zychaea mexicana TaxID=64656 RepID=UPI0022FEDC27|nr:uncharacterized protein BDB00DRAFT_156444 [Zychaea mexicana]KAI9484281.1 hypothetical protein BDB00DRAFT_156444 [Zychaea mexicana]
MKQRRQKVSVAARRRGSTASSSRHVLPCQEHASHIVAHHGRDRRHILRRLLRIGSGTRVGFCDALGAAAGREYSHQENGCSGLVVVAAAAAACVGGEGAGRSNGISCRDTVSKAADDPTDDVELCRWRGDDDDEGRGICERFGAALKYRKLPGEGDNGGGDRDTVRSRARNGVSSQMLHFSSLFSARQFRNGAPSRYCYISKRRFLFNFCYLPVQTPSSVRGRRFLFFLHPVGLACQVLPLLLLCNSTPVTLKAAHRDQHDLFVGHSPTNYTATSSGTRSVHWGNQCQRQIRS